MAFPTVTVRAAFGEDAFAAAPSWTDISNAVKQIAIRRGRNRALDRMQEGQCSVVLDNRAGDFWPTNTAGAYYPDILPMVRISVQAVYGGTTYDLFHGFAVQWKPGFGATADPASAICTLTAVDLTRCLSQLEITDAGGLTGSVRTDERAEELVEGYLGWPGALTDWKTGQTTVSATGALSHSAAASLMQQTEEAEAGYFFVAADGKATFHGRHTRLGAPYSTSQATYGDDSAELGYHAIEIDYDDSQITNEVRFTRTGGSEQVVSDATSIATYGPRTLTRTGMMMTTDAVALGLAQFYLSRYKDPALRVRSITIRPMADEANLYPDVCGFDIATRITLRYDAAEIDSDYHIEGIEHLIDRGKFWETKWWLSDADSQEYWVLGTSALGIGTRLGY